MPYEIIQTKDGFKVCKKDKSKCFSKEGIPKERAIKQLKAIGMNEHKLKGGLRPLTSRIGGKNLLKKKIVNDYFPKDYENMIYVEPFVGGGSIFFYKEPSIKEIINDKDKELINLYKGYKKYDGQKISSDIDGKYNKEEFDKIKDSNPKSEYDKFIKNLILHKTSFFGKSKSFNGNRHYIKSNLNGYKDRLKNVEILNKDFKDIIKKYDSPNTFFYLDPPYENSKGLYENFELPIKDVYDLLKNIKGKFLISYNDSKEAKQLFKDFHIDYIKTTYVDPLKGGNDRDKTEMIISNFDNKLEGGAEGDIFDQKRYDSLVSYAETDKAREKYNKKRERFPKMDSYEDYLTKLKDIARQRSTTNKYELQRIEFEKQKTKQLNDMALENYKKHPEDIPMKCKLNENLEVVNDTTTAGECQRRHQLYQQKQKEADEKTPIGMIMKGLTTYGDILTSVIPMPAIVKDAWKLGKDLTGQKSFLDGNGMPILEGNGAIPSLDILHKLTMQSYQPKAMNRIGQFNLISETPTLKFYKDDLSNTIIVSIRGTDDKEDLKADGLIAIGKLESSNRYLKDLETLKYFQAEYPPSEFDYYGVAHSLGGAIADLFLKQGLIKSAVSYNPAVQPQDFSDTTSLNRRIYLESDPLYKIMGKYLTNKPEVRPARNTSIIEKAINLIPSAPESSETPIWRKAIDLIPKASKAYNLYKSHQLTQFDGGGKSKFQKQLQKLNITQDEYLDYAKKIAKLRGYDDDKLELSNDGKHKLEYDGVPFGAVNYMDFILYLHLVKEGKIPYEEAIKNMTNYRKRAKKVMEATKSKVSPASLAYNITW